MLHHDGAARVNPEILAAEAFGDLGKRLRKFNLLHLIQNAGAFLRGVLPLDRLCFCVSLVV